MDIFKQFASDSVAEVEGKEIQIGEDSWITVARANNKNYNKELKREWDAKRYSLSQKNDASEKLAEDLLVGILAKTMLVGWRGKIEYQGKPLAYSVENAKLLLSVKDFRDFVTKHSEDFENFKIAEEVEDVKN